MQHALLCPTQYTRSDPDLFLYPTEFILDEHYYQRSICDLLDSLSHNPRHALDGEEFELVREYLARDLRLHHADEDEDLLPLLKSRCPDKHAIENIAAVLKREHRMDKNLARKVLVEIDRLAHRQALRYPVQFFRDAGAFAMNMRRHLAWENSVILPLARKWLRSTDLAYFGHGMAERRGISMHGA